MSGITTGIGLISGINTAQLIEQLMAIEARPIRMLEARSEAIDQQRAAFATISAQLLAMQNAATKFKRLSFFRQFTSTSSDESVITAIASEGAKVGSVTMRVHSLVSTHSLASRGFADADQTPVGIGTIRLESALARVDRATDLDALNGGHGVRRGTITITDRSGASAEIDLSMAFTVADVLDAINSTAGINVRAYVTGVGSNGAQGDRIVIVDESGSAGLLTVADKDGGFTAQDLGIAASVSASRIDGADVYRLSESTLLSSLNDGNGVHRLKPGEGDDLTFQGGFGSFGVSLAGVLTSTTDIRALNAGNGVRLGVIRITDRTGASAEIDLSEAKTVGDIQQALSATNLKITVSVTNSKIVVKDTTVVPPPEGQEPDPEENPDTPQPVLKTLKIEDITGSAAADLGLAGEVEGNTLESSALYRMETVGDLVRAISFAAGNENYVWASVSADGSGITLQALDGAGEVSVTSGGGGAVRVSHAAEDLGLVDARFSAGANFTSRPLIGGINTVLLRTLAGGRAALPGTVSFTDGLGRTAQIDFSSATTLQDVIDILNADTRTSISASISSNGNAIEISDGSVGGGTVTIGDVTGSLAADLGIAGQFDVSTSGRIQGGDLERQYISRQTTLDSLNEGRGVNPGLIGITDSAGGIFTVDLDTGHETVGELIDYFNLVTPDHLEARINDGGDGIVIIDHSSGTGRLKIEDREGGTAAADLRLAGVASTGTTFIDGSFELHVNVDASDSLSDIAAKINGLGGGYSASIVSDGGATNPFALTVSSTVSGRQGEILIDSGALDLGFTTLTRPRDAVVTVGQSGAGPSMLVTNSTNVLKNVIPGVTVNLLAESDMDITVTTDQDLDSMVEAIQGFVEAYNEAQAAIDEGISFDSETSTRGPLMGDATVSLVRSRLRSAMSRAFSSVDPQFTKLFSIGIRLVGNNRLEFNAQKFRDAYEESPEAVEELFTLAEEGFGARLEKVLDELTRASDGILSRKDDALGDQQDVLADRIERLNLLLEAKRKRLETQFIGLESSLAALQDQQTSLSTLAMLAGQ